MKKDVSHNVELLENLENHLMEAYRLCASADQVDEVIEELNRADPLNHEVNHVLRQCLKVNW